jgi:ATP-binding cassette, subfamily C, bacterial PrsD
MAKPPTRAVVRTRTELGEALDACRSTFWAIALFSGMSNILMLTGSIFMLEVYDRVLPSRSVSTLVALLLLAAGLYGALAILDLIRGRIMVRIGNSLDEAVSERVYDAIVRLPLIIGNRGDGIQPLRDLDAVRSFLSGLGPIAFFDLPWIPFYLAICFAFHPYIGLTALVGAVVLVALTLVTEVMMRRPGKDVADYARNRSLLAEASRRNSEAILAMGMNGRLAKRWTQANQQYVTANRVASDVGGGLGALSKVLRMLLQSMLLAVGALLVINQQATAGVIIAGSILGARALAPVDLAIANWKAFIAARQGWGRLNQLLMALPAATEPMTLDAPTHTLVVENASAAPPGEQKIVVFDVTLKLEAGRGLGIIGPTASGKSSLARLLVGVWRPVRGRVSLDGAALDQWSPEGLGRHVGYLPQDVELLAGTVAQNISRFEEDADPNLVLAAAKAAGVHDLIVSLPDGYSTQVGEHGAALSAGQGQRIALARALYRDPFLVVLDEPNANLDSEGDEALTQAILSVRKRNGIVVVVAHRPSAITGVDLILVMAKGRMHHFGPKDEVLAKALPRPPGAPRPLQVVPDSAGRSA